MVDSNRRQGIPALDAQSAAALVPMELALDAAPLGIAITDPNQPDNPIVFANRELTAITGYGPEELLGRNMRLLQGPGTDRANLGRVREAITRGEAVRTELLNYRKNGESFWMEVDIRPIRDASGRLVAFIGGLTDLTQARDAEERVKQSETRLRAFTGAIPLPMLTVCIDGTIRRANQAAEEALGVPAGSLPGRHVQDFAEEDEIAESSLFHQIQYHDSVYRVETRARRPDGQLLWLLASAQRFKAQSEDRYVLVFQDVTQLKQKEQRLTEANEEAERNIRARMRFLAAASHDLRQPLQAMALFASALDHHVATPQGRTIVQSLKTSLRGMEEMFDALLDMSKLDAGVMKAEPQIFLINDIFEQLETTYGPQAEAAGLELRVVPSSAALKSDPRLLTRIIGNFLSNAIRYTRSGTVLLGVRHHGSRVRVAVYDTGPGIPESQRLEIFREFRQCATPNAAGHGAGTGLGLSIVQRLARLLGHALDVRSTEGRGSVFAVDVPLAEEFLPVTATASKHEEVHDVSGTTVVVVDDDPDIQEGLEMLLEEWGCTPVVAASADEAIAMLTELGVQPDAILADLHLHDKNSGVAAINSIRQRTGVAATAYLFTGDTGAPAEIGGNENLQVLRKPLDPMRLRVLLGALRR
ncbi:MAG: PAS domain S-box protein [Rhodospirillaceae bacterium]|nr:PAS domain S-box protein [Rhodospirillales bacterium]